MENGIFIKIGWYVGNRYILIFIYLVLVLNWLKIKNSVVRCMNKIIYLIVL